MAQILTQEEKRQRLAKIRRLEAELQGAKEQVNQIGEQYGWGSPELERAQRGLEMTHFERPPPKPITSQEELMGLGRSLTEGATLGLGDEIGTGLAAGWARGQEALQRARGEDVPERSYGEIYDSMMDQYEDEQGRYVDENPGMSLIGNMVGGAGTGGATLLKSANLWRNAPWLLRTPLTGGVLAAEGAAIGAASAPRDQRAAGAATGALMNPAFFGAAHTAGGASRGLVDALTNRRIDVPLGRGDDFVPINMAQAEGVLPSFYRKVIAQSAGGRGVREQSAKVFERALEKQKAAQRKFNIAEAADKSQAELAKTKLDYRKSRTEDMLRKRGATAQADAAERAQAAAEARKSQFRQEAVKKSLPVDAPKEWHDEFAQYKPIDANLFLDEAWKDRGFQMVRNRRFVAEPDLITRDVRRRLNNPAQREFANDIVNEIQNSFTRDGKPITQQAKTRFRTNRYGVPEPTPPEPTGKVDIDGDALIQIRNDLRMRAAQMSESGAGAIEANALRKAAHAIDNQIENQLDTAAKRRYRQDLENWGARRTYDMSVQKAVKTKQGNFDPEDWLGSGMVYSPSRAARRNAPLQDQAYRLQDDLAAGKTQSARDLGEAKADVSRGLAKSRERIARQKSQIKPRESTAFTQAQNRLDAAKETAAEMHRRMPAMDPSAWTQRFNAQVLGTPFGGPANVSGGLIGEGAGRLLGGLGVAQALGTQRGQRVLAGQTRPQEFMQRILRGYDQTVREPLHRAGYGVLRAGATNTED